MKKAACSVVLMFLAGIMVPLGAVELTVGAMGWYTYWIPPWQKGYAVLPAGFKPGQSGASTPTTIRFRVNNFESDARYPLLGGPLVQLRLHDRVSISAAGLAGKFIFTSDNGKVSPPFLFFDSYYRKTIVKYDADAALNIGITGWLKVFAGCKIQGYQYDEKLYYWATNVFTPNITDSGMFYAKAKDRFLNVGPGIGFGFTAPLGGDFYLLCNLSGLVLFGEEKYIYQTKLKYAYLLSGSGSMLNFGKFYISRFFSLGGNGTLSLAYVVPGTKATISLGVRYQMLKYYHDSGYGEYFNYDGYFDHFMGATVSVTYGFTLGKGNES